MRSKGSMVILDADFCSLFDHGQMVYLTSTSEWVQQIRKCTHCGEAAKQSLKCLDRCHCSQRTLNWYRSPSGTDPKPVMVLSR